MRRLFYIVFLSVLSTSTNGQKLNFDAIEKYFSLTDSLRQNKPLSDKDWNELLSTRGVQLYIKNNNLSEDVLKSYRRNFELAYMPKNDSIRDARLKEKETYFKLWVFNNYKTQETALKNYYKKIKVDNRPYLDSVYANCYTMLPKKMHKKSERTTIYFIPLMNDALAEGDDIVITLYNGYHFDKLKYGAVVGHEMHHIIRKNKTIDKSKDEYLYDALSLLLNEGSADLIEKKYSALEECPEDLRYFEYLMEIGSKSLAALDTAILEHIDNTHPITKTDLPNISPMSGHIPGCFMATIIDRNGLTQDLIKKVDDPIRFILLYNKAAKKDKDKPYVFSDKTISYVKNIRQKNSR